MLERNIKLGAVKEVFLFFYVCFYDKMASNLDINLVIVNQIITTSKSFFKHYIKTTLLQQIHNDDEVKLE